MPGGVPNRSSLLIPILICLLSPAAFAQEVPAQVWIKIVGVRSMGKKQKGQEVAGLKSPELKPFAEALSKLEYDRHVHENTSVLDGGPKVELAFPKIAKKDYAAKVTWSGTKEAIVLKMTVTRPAKAPKKGDEKVADLEVKVSDGGHYVIKCPKAYPDGDLVLLVTASTKPLKKD